MYVIYVISVFAGDGFSIPFLQTLLSPWRKGQTPGATTTKGGGGFDWVRFRDTLLRRQGINQPVLLMLASGPTSPTRFSPTEGLNGSLPFPVSEGEEEALLCPLGDGAESCLCPVAEGDEDATDSPFVSAVSLGEHLAGDAYGMFSEEPDLDVPLGSAEEFLRR